MLFGLIGALVGAGFASGREIMQFFSQYGPYSWPLIVFSSLLMGGLVYGIAGHDVLFPEKKGRAASWMMALLYLAVGGGMAAAAGNLWALTLPVRHARAIGSVFTLVCCGALSGRSLRGLNILGKLLVPCLILLFFLCLSGADGDGAHADISFAALFRALWQAASYCGMNVLLAAPVLQGGADHKNRKSLAVQFTIIVFLLLSLGNAALLPHADGMRNEALPTVLLLRRFGKPGYYFSALALYLAVMTTLAAALRGLNMPLAPRCGKWTPWVSVLLMEAVSLVGFQEIVERAYPILGLASLIYMAASIHSVR